MQRKLFPDHGEYGNFKRQAACRPKKTPVSDRRFHDALQLIDYSASS